MPLVVGLPFAEPLPDSFLMQLFNPQHMIFVCLSVFGLWAGSGLQNACSQIPAETTSGSSQLEATFGIDGFWKLGHVCPVRVEFTLPAEIPSQVDVQLGSIDGDGVELKYIESIPRERFQIGDGRAKFWTNMRVGRLNTPITMRIVAGEQILAQRRFEANELPLALPSTQPFILAIGSTLGIEQASTTSVSDGSSSFVTALVSSADELPDRCLSLSGCDLLLLATSDGELLKSLRPDQWQALDQWIRQGGGCFLSLGANTRQLCEIDAFRGLLAGQVEGSGKVTNPGILESYVGTDQPLSDFEVILHDTSRAIVDLLLTDSRNRRLGWLLRHAHGLGVIQTISSDLNQPAIADWGDRNKLWKLLLSRFIDKSFAEQAQKSKVGETSYLGYDDLVGQLRATLDVFPSVRSITFGQVAFTVILFLLLIGPADYYLSVKFLKRPSFSWFYAGAVLTLVSLGLVVLRFNLRPDEIRVNSARIFDIDVASQRAVGHIWSHVYNGNARLLDVSFKAVDPAAPVDIDWQGLPGRGLGGLLSQLDTDRAMPSYNIVRSTAGTSQVESVGVTAGGTKCFSGVWHQQFPVTKQLSLREIAGIDQLEGTLVNPLDVDLKDGMLIYHNWYYSLPGRILPGQTIPISFDTIPKDLPRRLNGRKIVDGAEHTTPWNPSDRDALPRLLEMLMFYKSASGSGYTTLQHRYQPTLDLSNLIQINRAVLVARIDRPPVVTEVTGKGAAQPIQEIDQTWCRIVIPVVPTKRK